MPDFAGIRFEGTAMNDRRYLIGFFIICLIIGLVSLGMRSGDCVSGFSGPMKDIDC